jgi:hypothetical protein
VFIGFGAIVLIVVIVLICVLIRRRLQHQAQPA